LTLKPSKKKSVGIGTGFFDSIGPKPTISVLQRFRPLSAALPT